MTLSKLTAFVALTVALLGAPAMAQTAPKAPGIPLFAEGQALGDPRAPVTMQAYLSFGCPHCIDWWAKDFPELKRKWIDTGTVRFVFVEMQAGHANLARAGVAAARCAPKETYWAVAEALFTTRPKLLKGAQDQDDYGQQLLDTDGWAVEALGKAGVDAKVWAACDKAAALAAHEARMQKAVAQYPGYEGGTPVFVFNGEPGEGGTLDWAEYSISRASKAAGRPLTTATRYDLFCAGSLTRPGAQPQMFEQRWSRQGELWRLTRGGEKAAPARTAPGGQVLSDGTSDYLLDGEGNLKLALASSGVLDAACAPIAPTPFPG